MKLNRSELDTAHEAHLEEQRRRERSVVEANRAQIEAAVKEQVDFKKCYDAYVKQYTLHGYFSEIDEDGNTRAFLMECSTKPIPINWRARPHMGKGPISYVCINDKQGETCRGVLNHRYFQ